MNCRENMKNIKFAHIFTVTISDKNKPKIPELRRRHTIYLFYIYFWHL